MALRAFQGRANARFREHESPQLVWDGATLVGYRLNPPALPQSL
jgi:hypothetical protein